MSQKTLGNFFQEMFHVQHSLTKAHTFFKKLIGVLKVFLLMHEWKMKKNMYHSETLSLRCWNYILLYSYILLYLSYIKVFVFEYNHLYVQNSRYTSIYSYNICNHRMTFFLRRQLSVGPSQPCVIEQ